MDAEDVKLDAAAGKITGGKRTTRNDEIGWKSKRMGGSDRMDIEGPGMGSATRRERNEQHKTVLETMIFVATWVTCACTACPRARIAFVAEIVAFPAVRGRGVRKMHK